MADENTKPAESEAPLTDEEKQEVLSVARFVGELIETAQQVPIPDASRTPALNALRALAAAQHILTRALFDAGATRQEVLELALHGHELGSLLLKAGAIKAIAIKHGVQ